MSLSLLDTLATHASRNPDRVAIVEIGCDLQDRHRISYASLFKAVNTFSRALHRNTSPDAVVVLCCPNQLEYYTAFLGTLAAGRWVLACTPDLTPIELARITRESRAQGIISSAKNCDTLRDQLQWAWPVDDLKTYWADPPASPVGRLRNDDEGGVLLQSSGTTGWPKIVRRRHRSLDAVAKSMVRRIEITPEDRVLTAVPLCHSYGLEHGLLGPLWAGASVHLCQGFDAGLILRELRTQRITIMPGVPFMFEALADLTSQDMNFDTLRSVYSAGAPLPEDVANRFAARFGVRIGQVYGSTEIGSVAYNSADGQHYDPRSVGYPLDGVQVQILRLASDEPLGRHPEPSPDPSGSSQVSSVLPGEQGQIAVTATSMMDGYLNDEQATAAAVRGGYFLTGDMGYVDSRGRLFITGRTSQFIEIGGRKVNPLEVEQVIADHPAVAECVVLPIRVTHTISRLKAVVTPANGRDSIAVDSVRQHARSRLAAYKVPRVIDVRMTLPKSPTGKILRATLESDG